MFDMTNPEALERSKNVQEAMQDFEKNHSPVRHVDGWFCTTCNQDWPCQRMEIMLLVQGVATLTTMIPSGNIGGLLTRFAGGGR